MRQVVEIDVSRLTRFSRDRHPLWLGIMMLILIETSVVASFIASYLYLMVGAEQWPPAGLEPPPVLWPTVNLVLLLTSIGTMWFAGFAINRGWQLRCAAGVSASVLLHCVVLVLRWQEFEAYEFRWDEHAYGSIVWTISGFHFVHVVSAIVGSAVIAVLAWMRYFTAERQTAVIVDTLYWYFVSGIWAAFYLVLYWVPRML